MFHFLPVSDPRISKILDFDGFGPANPPKFPSGLKFWPSPTISATHVPYRNPRCRLSYLPPRSSLGALIHRGLVIKFTSTLLKPVGDLKPDGCDCGCDFSPVGVAAGGYGCVPRV
jgi:hypothetical protein